MINDQIERLRLSTVASLLSGRRDIIVVSSVSCIYGMGNPDDFSQNVINIKVGQRISRNIFLRKLVDSLYYRTELELTPGQFRVKGDTVDVMLSFEEIQLRVIFGVMRLKRFRQSTLPPELHILMLMDLIYILQIYL